MQKVILLANKWWEAVTLVSVLEHARNIKPDFSACPCPFEIISRRAPLEYLPKSRLICRVGKCVVEVLCIEDFIPSGRNSSSSIEKQCVLRSLAADGEFDDALIIAFGTAASPAPDCAGNVIIGSKVFVFDASQDKDIPESAKFTHGVGEIVDSHTGASLIDDSGIERCFEQAQKRFLSPGNNPSRSPRVLSGSTYVAVGVINVLRSTEYSKYDPMALMLFESEMKEQYETQSIETTHGLIRLCIDRPFMYVSGIANQIGMFEEEVSPNKYSQNFAASHNAAVSVAWMLPQICEWLSGRSCS